MTTYVLVILYSQAKCSTTTSVAGTVWQNLLFFSFSFRTGLLWMHQTYQFHQKNGNPKIICSNLKVVAFLIYLFLGLLDEQ